MNTKNKISVFSLDGLSFNAQIALIFFEIIAGLGLSIVGPRYALNQLHIKHQIDDIQTIERNIKRYYGEVVELVAETNEEVEARINDKTIKVMEGIEAGANEEIFIKHAIIPSDLVNPDKVTARSRFGGAVLVASQKVKERMGDGFSIAYTKWPKNVCEEIVTQLSDFGDPSLVGIATSFETTTTFPLKKTDVQKICMFSEVNEIVFTFTLK